MKNQNIHEEEDVHTTLFIDTEDYLKSNQIGPTRTFMFESSPFFNDNVVRCTKEFYNFLNLGNQNNFISIRIQECGFMSTLPIMLNETKRINFRQLYNLHTPSSSSRKQEMKPDKTTDPNYHNEQSLYDLFHDFPELRSIYVRVEDDENYQKMYDVIYTAVQMKLKDCTNPKLKMKYQNLKFQNYKYNKTNLINEEDVYFYDSGSDALNEKSLQIVDSSGNIDIKPYKSAEFNHRCIYQTNNYQTYTITRSMIRFVEYQNIPLDERDFNIGNPNHKIFIEFPNTFECFLDKFVTVELLDDRTKPPVTLSNLVIPFPRLFTNVVGLEIKNLNFNANIVNQNEDNFSLFIRTNSYQPIEFQLTPSDVNLIQYRLHAGEKISESAIDDFFNKPDYTTDTFDEKQILINRTNKYYESVVFIQKRKEDFFTLIILKDHIHILNDKKEAIHFSIDTDKSKNFLSVIHLIKPLNGFQMKYYINNPEYFFLKHPNGKEISSRNINNIVAQISYRGFYKSDSCIVEGGKIDFEPYISQMKELRLDFQDTMGKPIVFSADSTCKFVLKINEKKYKMK
jgi:hypothetical protein